MDVVQQKQDKQLQHQTQEQQHIREDQQEVPPQRPRQQNRILFILESLPSQI